MRHNKHHASLGVTREHREAMLSNMGASLIKHGRIETTLTKAKALRPFIEKIRQKSTRTEDRSLARYLDYPTQRKSRANSQSTIS